LTKQEREKLGGALKLEDFDPAVAVFHEGDQGDVFYIIKEGAASVQIGGKSKTTMNFLNSCFIFCLSGLQVRRLQFCRQGIILESNQSSLEIREGLLSWLPNISSATGFIKASSRLCSSLIELMSSLFTGRRSAWNIAFMPIVDTLKLHNRKREGVRPARALAPAESRSRKQTITPLPKTAFDNEETRTMVPKQILRSFRFSHVSHLAYFLTGDESN